METSLSSFASSFLECVMGAPPTQSQVDMLVAVTRRADSERLVTGDYVMPLNAPKLKAVTEPTTLLGRLLHNPTQESIRLVEQSLEGCRVPVANIVVQKGMLRIHLDRAKVMNTCIPRIAKEGLRYGASEKLKQVAVTINHRTTHSPSHNLRNIRGVKLTNHLSNILEFCGARNIRKVSSKARPRLMDQEDNEREGRHSTTLEPQRHPLEQCARGTSAAYSMDSRLLEGGAVWCDGEEGEVRQRPCSEGDDKPKRVPPDSADRETNTCTPQSDVETQATQTPSNRTSETRLHVNDGKVVKPEGSTSLTQGTTDRQKDEVSEVEFVMTDSMKGVKGGPWVYQYSGVVEAKTGHPCTASPQEYCQLLVEELRHTSEMRQREVEGPEWMASLEEQAQRCLTLQLLSASHSNPVRLQVDGDTHNTKEASFIMYNYARLTSILDQFEQCVQQGDVPPLPPAEDVDFSLLKCDEEWELVWLYLLRWPEIMEEMALGVLEGRRMKTAQVSRFLYILSHRWSEYYGRYQVLSRGFLPHLLPLMYARLHLLQALSTLMRVCFALLGVDSLPSQM